MAKYAAFGAQFKRGTSVIAQVSSISGPGLSLDTADVTSHDGSGWEEVVPTILRSGEVSLDLVFDPNLATHKNASGGLLYDLTTRAKGSYSLVFPVTPAVTWSFSAYVIAFEPSLPVGDAMTATVTLKLTDQPTLA